MPSPRSAHSSWLIFAAIILIGLNLRPILAAVGPLLGEIQQATGLSDSLAGMLTTLPIIGMGLCALFAGVLQRHIGEYRGIAAGMLLMALACAARSLGSDAAGIGGSGMIVTAALGGLGIALVQALLPGFIKRAFPLRAGQLMSLYTTAIMAGAALAAASAAPMAQHIGWTNLLGLWALPAFIALGVWLATARAVPAQTHFSGKVPMGSGRVWMLVAFFGLGTGAYTLALAWLPSYYVDLGWSPARSGVLLGGITLTEVLSGLVVSALLGVCHDRRWLLLPVLGMLMAGLALLTWAPLYSIGLVTLCIGVGIGALFPLSLVVALDQVRHPDQAGPLLGLVQGGGYLLASLMPLIAGLIRTHFSDLSNAWLLMMGGTVLMILIVFRLSPGSRI